MKHSFLDRYSDGDSFMHRLDPRTKFGTALLFILAVALTPPGSWRAFGLYLVIITALLLPARVPILYILKRSLVVMPFVAMLAIFIPFFKGGEVAGSYNVWLWQLTVTYSGIQVLINILLKSWLSILSLIWLTSTTRLPDLLQGLERMRMPRVLVMLMSFMYRYLFILVDEVMRMKQARDSRSFGGRSASGGWQIRTVGNMIGTLFIRSYERGERVYAAMSARGFDGNIRTLNHLSFRLSDALFGMGYSLILIFVGIFSQLY
ncbi:MAG: cobalt ECF transporter T component CbiQ [Dehalococcoidia bacterium]|nr:cobalt ECF transporter T component CbiQ [Dehalococcoidia bacterium]